MYQSNLFLKCVWMVDKSSWHSAFFHNLFNHRSTTWLIIQVKSKLKANITKKLKGMLIQRNTKKKYHSIFNLLKQQRLQCCQIYKSKKEKKHFGLFVSHQTLYQFEPRLNNGFQTCMHASFFTPAASSLLLIRKVPNEEGAESTLEIFFYYAFRGN